MHDAGRAGAGGSGSLCGVKASVDYRVLKLDMQLKILAMSSAIGYVRVSQVCILLEEVHPAFQELAAPIEY